MHHTQFIRRYDIDWLRVIAFGVLILYHIGMYYVADWGWHIKSDTTFVWLQDLMVLTNPWRMSLLFFISGLALALTYGRYGSWQLVSIKTTRLFVPLLFGMFVIVTPQVYYEALSQNLIEPGYFSFWLQYINPNTSLLTDHHSPIGLLTWNHLWFLPYVWTYCIVLIALAFVLQQGRFTQWLKRIPFLLFVVGAASYLIAMYFWLREDFPPTNALLDDWYNHAKYFGAFVFGYLFAVQSSWWQKTIEHRNKLVIGAVVTYIVIVADRHQLLSFLSEHYETSVAVQTFYAYLFAGNYWMWILACVGLVGHHLNKPSRVLSYLNKAILPYYLLHQTVIIVIAWWLKSLNLNAFAEFPLLLSLTVLSCILGYEILKRFTITRFLSGLPMKQNINVSNSVPLLNQANS